MNPIRLSAIYIRILKETSLYGKRVFFPEIVSKRISISYPIIVVSISIGISFTKGEENSSSFNKISLKIWPFPFRY